MAVRKVYHEHWFWLSLSAVVLIFSPLVFGSFGTKLLSEVLIMALAAMALNLIIGYMGQLSELELIL